MPSPLLTSVRELVAYTIWADRALLTALRGVSPEDLVRDTGSSFPSLLATMGHILGAERVWLSRFIGAPLHLPSLSDFPDFPSLERGFEELWADLGAYLGSLQESDLGVDLTWTNTKGETRTQPLLRLLFHLTNHGSYHRGQMVTMLRQMGHAAPSSDMVYYLADHYGA